MKHQIICVWTFILLLFSQSIECAKAQYTELFHVDWPTFIAKQDIVWDKLPEHWYDAGFLGNGMMGMLLYKEPEQNHIHMEVSNCAVHDHRQGNDLFGKPRLFVGHFKLIPQGQILSGKMRLDLWNAELTTEVITEKGKIHITSFVHADDMLILLNVRTEGEEQAYRWEWVPAPSESPRWLYAKTKGSWITLPEVYPPNPEPHIIDTPTGGVSVQSLQAGGETAVCWDGVKANEHSTNYFINISHSYPDQTASDTAIRVVGEATNSAGYDALRTTHRQWWNAFYPAGFISVPDAKMEQFYWIQMYKLASATRGDRALIDTCGPWLAETPWPNVWWNLNVQLTYWPLNASNHLSLAASLENAIYNHTDHLRACIHEDYRADSYAIGRTSDLQCASETVGRPGIDKLAEVGNLTWACHNLWLIYRHKMDDELLRHRLFPVLKGAINYYLHFLEKKDDGYLHLPTTYSPEYGSASDCSYDLMLLKWGASTLLSINERLNLNDPLAAKWKEITTTLTPFPQDETGLMIGDSVPYARSHRHYSHLLAIFPLYTINRHNPDDVELIKRSLAHWQSKPSALLGYSLTGASSISSAIGNGNDALMYLEKLFGKWLSITTMYKEAGPVIETPLSAAQAIHDMLLQSWGGTISVFPAVPDAWLDVTFHKLLTEGAFEVSAKRISGKTTVIHIRSLAGEPCILETDIEEPKCKDGKHILTPLAPHVYQVNLKKGEEVTIL